MVFRSSFQFLKLWLKFFIFPDIKVPLEQAMHTHGVWWFFGGRGGRNGDSFKTLSPMKRLWLCPLILAEILWWPPHHPTSSILICCEPHLPPHLPPLLPPLKILIVPIRTTTLLSKQEVIKCGKSQINSCNASLHIKDQWCQLSLGLGIIT